MNPKGLGGSGAGREDAEAKLHRFQDTGAADDLLAYIREAKEEPASYERVVAALTPVLNAVTFGWMPDYSRIDSESLARNPAELDEIIALIEGSEKADLAATGIALRELLAERR